MSSQRHVELRVRQIMARAAFKAGGFEARLEALDRSGISTGAIIFTTRGHETWAAAATAALKKADRTAWIVDNRAGVAHRIASETTSP